MSDSQNQQDNQIVTDLTDIRAMLTDLVAKSTAQEETSRALAARITSNEETSVRLADLLHNPLTTEQRSRVVQMAPSQLRRDNTTQRGQNSLENISVPAGFAGPNGSFQPLFGMPLNWNSSAYVLNGASSGTPLGTDNLEGVGPLSSAPGETGGRTGGQTPNGNQGLPSPPRHGLRQAENLLDRTGGPETHQSNTIAALSFKLSQNDEEIRILRSQIHQATSSAPEIDKIISETSRTPFTDRIARARFRSNEKLRLPLYEGKTDPKAHMTAFTIAVSRAHLEDDVKDAGYCRYFVENLGGPALEWFSTLQPNSIDCFKTLSTMFLKHYSLFIENNTSDASLWALAQAPDESLRDFIQRFKQVKSRVSGMSDSTALAALRHGLWHESRFREDLIVNAPISIDDALHRASNWAQAEDEKQSLAKKYASFQQTFSSSSSKSGGLNKFAKKDQLDQKSSYQRQSNYNVEKNPYSWHNSEGEEKYCIIHKETNHSTRECRRVRDLLVNKFEQGELDLDLLAENEKYRPRPRNESARAEAADGDMISKLLKSIPNRPTSSKRERPSAGDGYAATKPAPRRRIDLIEADEEVDEDEEVEVEDDQVQAETPKKRVDCIWSMPQFDRNEPASMEPPRRVDYILGGSQICGGSVNSVKAYQRRAISKGPLPYSGTNSKLVFADSETASLDKPHDDALVIELDVGHCVVSRIMVDTGSSVDLIFSTTLSAMGIPKSELEGPSAALVGFSGETTMSLGTIKLPVAAADVIHMVTFTVVDRVAPFNIIMGRPWLYLMKAVPSTYHQCLKFPGLDGTQRTIRGSQAAARICYLGGHRMTQDPK